MTLRSSEIDRLIDLQSDSDESADPGSGSEVENNILSHSGTDSYEPSSASDPSDEDHYEESRPKRRKVATVGRKRSIEELLQSMDNSQVRDSCSSSQSLNCSVQDPLDVNLDSSQLDIDLQDNLTSQQDNSTPTVDPRHAQQDAGTVHENSRIRTVRVIKGKNGHCWTKEPRSVSSRMRARNIVYCAPKVKGTARNATTPSECFLSFITDNDIENIVHFTNDEIRRRQINYNEITASFKITDSIEIKAFIGILLFSAIHKDNHLSTEVMFDKVASESIYKATFSEKRFSFLLDCLRFDDKETREERRENDKFAPIREFWNSFIKKCLENYDPGPYLTIDEQLLAFRGRCPFKMYMPKKPGKYGIKIVMICDVGTKYMLNAEPYLGKGTTTRPVSHYYGKHLSTPFYGTNRNLTMDNWFSSIPLTIELSKTPINLTVIGTIRRDKRELPTCMTTPKNREIGDTRYLYDGTITLVSEKVKSNKVVCLISSMHDTGGTSASGKPIIIEHYNQTKGGVDAFDQMCSTVSCSRRTKRWPMCIFFGMINMAGINTWIVHNVNLRGKNEKQISRRNFLKAVYKEFVTPFLERRLQLPTIQRNLKSIISEVLMKSPTPQRPAENNTRTTCKICPSKKRRMTTSHCKQCGQAYCNEHRGGLCCNCTDQD